MSHLIKMALIIPLHKKLDLDLEIFKNFRPVSNLAYLSKLLERDFILDHIFFNLLHEIFQSAYKTFHSQESALARVQSNIHVLTALDEKKYVFLILLELSATFNTIDHATLLYLDCNL